MNRARPHLPAPHARSDSAGAGSDPSARFETGSATSDARLGGLARAALHEVYAAMPDDGCVAAGFALLLALRGCRERQLIWAREDRAERRSGQPYPHGLIELGIHPDAVLLVTAPDALSLLRAGADIVNCGAVGAVILELWGKAPALDLTASRRLALAAAKSGVMVLVVRSGVDPAPSATQTRWQVSGAPSRALAANVPGPPAFDITLLRHRGGIAGFDARVEWDRDRKAFRDAPLSGGVPAIAVGGTGVEGARRAA